MNEISRTTVDHAHLDRLEAQSRRDHQTARQALAAIDRQTLAAAPPPADMTDAYLSGVLAHVAAGYGPPTRWMRAAIAEAATRMDHP